MPGKQWEGMTIKETLEEFQVDSERGLTENEARRRLELVGLNQLKEQKKISAIALFVSQFTDFMVLVLLGATIVSAMLGEYADAITILIIVILNAVLGFVQEFRAEKSLEKLKQLTAQETMVKREGTFKKISANLLVPGDLILLTTGDVIPADLRLIEGSQLEINEAVLTGESEPVKKRIEEVYPEKTALGDRKNMAYMGTVITRGKGVGLVVATGMNTEMGKIAGYIQEIQDEATPLQKRLNHLGKCLVFCCLLIVGIVVLLGLARGESLYRMVLTGVSLAVAAIPEGLPAIVTVVLALGVQRMVKRQAIVRALPAVETLGCVTVICSDKTGTLTQNEMTVRQFFLSDELISFSGEGYTPHGKIKYLTTTAEKHRRKNKAGLELALKIAALCNNAYLKKKEITITGLLRRQKEQWEVLGDPTEGALLVSAAKGGFWREHLEKKEMRIAEIPFDSERKRMSVIYQQSFAPHKFYVYTKGAPDILIDLCNRVWWDGEVVPLTAEIKAKILLNNEQMAAQALRVIGLGYREIPAEFFAKHITSKDKAFLAESFLDLSRAEEKALENDLIFVSLAGMIDPPRPSAQQALNVCRRAGIKTVMITGDHKKTAEVVAKELQLVTASSPRVLTGNELDALTDIQLKKVINQVAVFARVSPRHKLRIVKTLKGIGHVVAMTGDGVNDAPAIKEADIGISMGLSGTDVTKEASSLVLANDDFATIVAAVEEGRVIYDNIRKFIRYLLACNTGEVLTMFVAALLGLPLPLLPIQILWVNLVTDGLPAMALGLDSGDSGIMQRKPRSPGESIFAHGLPKQIIGMGVLICLSTLLAFISSFYVGGQDLTLARTVAFTTLVMAQLFYVFQCRTEKDSSFNLSLFSNLYLVGAVLCSFGMQLAVIYLPFFQQIFKTTALQFHHWGLILCFTAGITLLQVLIRTVKIRRRRYAVFFNT